ncbi:MAG: MBL fold metallo-hydrolase [Marinicaulis sp.]|nr:MBL fold metallo-hydrolase [Marinicaulis sp.]
MIPIDLKALISPMALSAIALVAAPSLAHDATARYIANEGVAISHDEQTIIFDAFFEQSYGQYAVPDSELQQSIQHGEPPFNNVVAVFVSHVHGDHFSPKPTIEFLRNNPSVALFGPEQVREVMLESGIAANDEVMKQLRTFAIAPEDDEVRAEINNLIIEAVAIPHSGNRPHIQNYSWRVTMGNEKTVMHFGDADTAVSNFSRHLAYFKARATHAAFPPYWFLSEPSGQLILRDIISAGNVIGIHVPARAAGNGDKWRAEYGGDLFTDPGQTRTISD